MNYLWWVLCGGVAHDKSVVDNYKKTKEGLVELGLDRRQLLLYVR
jgi:hypothetical protein